jgi:hypothetical protein
MTSSQFGVLLAEISELRKEMNARFDKIEGRISPLEDEYQKGLGANERTKLILGYTRGTVALILASVTAFFAAWNFLYLHLKFF